LKCELSKSEMDNGFRMVERRLVETYDGMN
jgi:hypothetical protein